jgi:hypothetical protein
MDQQFWGYEFIEEIYLGVRKRKMLKISGLENTLDHMFPGLRVGDQVDAEILISMGTLNTLSCFHRMIHTINRMTIRVSGPPRDYCFLK